MMEGSWQGEPGYILFVSEIISCCVYIPSFQNLNSLVKTHTQTKIN